MRTIPREVNRSVDKASFTLSEKQKSILVGTILGDAGIRYRGFNCRLHVKHALKQLSLVNFKWKSFRNITSMNVSVFSQRVGNKDYNFAEFVTQTHPEFTKYYNLFYKSSKKIVPLEIGELLIHPLSLAVWFMDDGTAEYAGASLQTHSFNKQDVLRLAKVVKVNYKIDANIHTNKGRWVIYFPKSSMYRLSSLLEPYILKDFRYKLLPYSLKKKVNPVETTRRDPVLPDYDIVRSA